MKFVKINDTIITILDPDIENINGKYFTAKIKILKVERSHISKPKSDIIFSDLYQIWNRWWKWWIISESFHHKMCLMNHSSSRHVSDRNIKGEETRHTWLSHQSRVTSNYPADTVVLMRKYALPSGPSTLNTALLVRWLVELGHIIAIIDNWDVISWPGSTSHQLCNEKYFNIMRTETI